MAKRLHGTSRWKSEDSRDEGIERQGCFCHRRDEPSFMDVAMEAVEAARFVLNGIMNNDLYIAETAGHS
jgi:hypothetical protein